MSGGTMSEQQVLPPLDVTKEDMGPNIPYIGLERTLLSRQNCRERQLRTALASLAQSEAERERLQGELARVREERDRWRKDCGEHGSEAVMMGNEIAELRAELARERERRQEAVNKLKRFSGGCKCSTCGVIREAIALLEPQPAPVVTGEK